jgi:hypothetical protein
LKLVKNKQLIITSACISILLICYYLLLGKPTFKVTKSITMASMVIEEKHHYIEPGEYFKMWIIGYNSNDKRENRELYKIYIEDSMIYNLLKEGDVYMISARSFREDKEFGYVYELTEISNQEEYQLRGKGRIK